MDALCQKIMKVDHLFVFQNIIKNIEFVCFKVIIRGGYFCIYIIVISTVSIFNKFRFYLGLLNLLYIYFKFKMYFIFI